MLGPHSYRYAAALYQTNDGTDALMALRGMSMSVIASSYIPAPASNIQSVPIHAGMDMSRGDSVVAVWGGGVEVIRDMYSSAASGQVWLTHSILWDAKTAHRTGAYKRLAWKIA